MLKCLNVKMAQKGVSLYLALMILSILLAIGLGITAIIVSQLQMIRGMGYSVVALYAADTGIDEVLYKDKFCRQQVPPYAGCRDDFDEDGFCDGILAGSIPGSLGEATYQANFNDEATSIQSVGTYKKTKRAIEVTR